MHCLMMPQSLGPHLSQIFTGFSMLHRNGQIRLQQACQEKFQIDRTKPPHLQASARGRLRVMLNDDIKLCYEVHDSFEIDVETAEAVDFYFKRSYDLDAIPEHLRSRVYPLGLNYYVTSDFLDRFEIQRAFAFGQSYKEKFSSLANVLARSIKVVPASMVTTCSTSDIYAEPATELEPHVIFMARAWDPATFDQHGADALDALHDINHTRAACIESLRAEFGEAFTGGFEHTGYAVKNFPDALMNSRDMAAKNSYFSLLKRAPICIATTGLHGSIGWKFAEYVALSKAIVTEKLSYSVPGDFRSGQNYLEFDTVDSCVARVSELFSNSDLRHQIMRNNNLYYADSLRPDMLVKNTLDIAVSAQAGR